MRSTNDEPKHEELNSRYNGPLICRTRAQPSEVSLDSKVVYPKKKVNNKNKIRDLSQHFRPKIFKLDDVGFFTFFGGTISSIIRVTIVAEV